MTVAAPHTPCAVVCRDNLDFMRSLPAACCTLIYADPPFFTGRAHTGRRAEHTFDDQWGDDIDAYLDFLLPRLSACRRLLDERGSLYVHLDWRAVHHARVRLDDVFGSENFLNEIIWSYRTGGVARRWFARKHDTMLLYARHAGRHVFNVQRAGEYRTDGLNRDADGRPYKSTRNGRLYFNADGPAVTDVWDLPFLSTVSSERCDYPTQKPLALLERIIRASSDAGDVVGDFFCGSGTTLVAAQRLGRRWIGCDVNPAAAALAQKRLAEERADHQQTAAASNAGPSEQQRR